MIFVGDDWAEAHHDVYLMDESGRRLGSRRLPEGLSGIRQLHELIAEHADEATDADGSVPVAPRRAVVEFPGPLVSEGHLDLSGQLHFCLADLARREITVVSDELHRLAE